MRWEFIGGEVELPGPMYRELPCPLAVSRETGGGDIAPGQRMTLFNFGKQELELVTYGLQFPGEETTQAIEALLKPGGSIPCVACQAQWLIRITYWAGDPARTQLGEGQLSYGNRIRPYDDSPPPRRPAPRVSSEPTKKVNPLDAGRQQRRLL